MQTRQTHRPRQAPKIPRHNSELINSPPQHSHFQSYPLGSDLSQCRSRSQGPPRRVSSSPGTRGKMHKAAMSSEHPTDTTSLSVHLNASQAPPRQEPTQLTIFETVTMPKMEPSSVTLKPAKLSRRPSRPPWAPMAATRSSSTTCKK